LVRLAARELDRLTLDVAERAGDLRQSEVAERARRAVAARLRDGEGPPLRGLPGRRAEIAFAHDGAGLDDREVGLRRKALRWERAVFEARRAVEERVGVLGVGRGGGGRAYRGPLCESCA